ncbi:MAG: hypothetical protein AAB116_07550, partial [Candidatus Poribacteria bacterium]
NIFCYARIIPTLNTEEPLLLRVFQLATLLYKRRFFAALRMTFYVTLNEVKGLLCAISEKLVLLFCRLD